MGMYLDTGRVDVNTNRSYGTTPLNHAVSNGHEAVVKLLLATGKCEVNLKDGEEWTPLRTVVESVINQMGIIQLLLATDNIEVNSKDARGQTPISRAFSAGL